jgi:hypothetical protein
MTAEMRFLALVAVEYADEVPDGRARDAALAALERMGAMLFPAFAMDVDGEERPVRLAGLEILDEKHLPCGAIWVCAGEAAAKLAKYPGMSPSARIIFEAFGPPYK